MKTTATNTAKKTTAPATGGKIAVIRMKGKFSLAPDIRTTLSKLRLGRLYMCTIIPQNEFSKGMLQMCKDVVAFGAIETDTVALLLQKRGHTVEGKKLSLVKKPEEISKLASEYVSSGKKLEDFGVKSIFFLAPPHGGFGGSRKAHAPEGPLGKNPEIVDLISRMA